MRHRTVAAALLVPLLILTSALPAGAIFGAISGALQRAQMIANQVVQISNQVRQMRTATRQLSELEAQLEYMRQAARGEVEALAEPFSELAAGPVTVIADGLAWGADFTGPAGQLVDVVRGMGSGGSLTGHWRSARASADRVGEAEILALFRDHRPEVSSRAVAEYRRARESADRQRVLDYATMDAAAALAQTIEGAQGSLDALTANGNLSGTALQQAQVAAALTQGRLDAAQGQLLAYQAVEQANRMQEAELARLERLGAWREARLRADQRLVELRASAARNREALREGLLLRVHPFYMDG